jgi:hypothetical protein
MGEAPTDLTWSMFPGPGPEWRRCVAVSDDGEVFAPAWIAGNEQKVGMCAAYDGGRAIVCDGHLYLPMSWLVREYPKLQEMNDALMRNLQRKPLNADASDMEGQQ